jgi:methyl-accepting chemotaxis protein
MKEFIFTNLPTLALGIPLSFYIVHKYYRRSIFKRIGFAWVLSLFLVVINTNATFFFPTVYPQFVATPLGVLVCLFLFLYAARVMKPLNTSINHLDRLSSGELSRSMELHEQEQQNEIGLINRSVSTLRESLRDTLSRVKSSARALETESDQLHNTARLLSSGANEQAGSVDEISASIEEMAANIEQNSENARLTNQIARSANENIREGTAAFQISNEAMQKIADRISIINDISFQTNILALNAAVEAARAGEHGKGFAVVAAEVRKLAERSKAAALEIQAHIKTGVEVSSSVAQKLDLTVPEIDKTAKLIQEIAAASAEQHTGAGQINKSIQQINHLTSENKANSEKVNESSSLVKSYSKDLNEALQFFKL